MTGILDFDINDKSGYRTEEYTSPADGRTFYRQVLVESTGFVFDIDIVVFNGDTGEKVVEDNFRDFKEFDQRNYDELLGLFENLRSLETQLVGHLRPAGDVRHPIRLHDVGDHAGRSAGRCGRFDSTVTGKAIRVDRSRRRSS